MQSEPQPRQLYMGTQVNSRVTPYVKVQGTHYEIGRQIGQKLGRTIREFHAEHEAISKYAAYCETTIGRGFFNSLLEACELRYPQYLDELRGIADETGMSFERLFLSNLRHEVQREVEEPEEDGCSSIIVNNDGHIIIGHNEDGNPIYGKYGYLLEVTITAPGQEEHFTAFSYPGILPGNAISTNKQGLVFTGNYIEQRDVALNKIPWTFCCRAMLASRDIDEVCKIWRDASHGISLNIGDARSQKVYNIEVAGNSKTTGIVDVLEVQRGHNYYHCNRYMRLDVPERTNTLMYRTSAPRMKFLQQGNPPEDMEMVCKKLGGRQGGVNTVYPQTSQWKTFATGIFDIKNKIWHFYRSNPATSSSELTLALT